MKKLLFISTLLTIFMFLVAGSIMAWEQPYHMDLDGRTITIGYHFDLEQRQFPEDSAANEWRQWVEKEFNVNIEFTHDMSPTQSSDFLNELSAQIMAGDTEADIYQIKSGNMLKAAALGFLHPVGDYIPWDQTQQILASKEGVTFLGDGQVYAYPVHAAPGGGILWNKKLFERHGLPNLYELVRNDEWTWDKLLEISKELTRDTSGDGEIDQFGILSEARIDHSAMQDMIAAHNSAETVSTEDGQLVSTIDSEPVIETLEFIADLYEYGGLERSFQQWRSETEFSKGNAGMIMIRWPKQIQKYAFKKDMEDYGFVPFPVGPSGDSVVRHLGSFQTLAIPVTEEDPESVLKVIWALQRSIEPWWDNPYYPFDDPDKVGSIEGQLEAMEEYVVDEDTLEMYKMVMESPGAPVSFNDIYAPEWKEIIYRIADGEKPTAVVAEEKAVIQTYLDEVFN